MTSVRLEIEPVDGCENGRCTPLVVQRQRGGAPPAEGTATLLVGLDGVELAGPGAAEPSSVEADRWIEANGWRLRVSNAGAGESVQWTDPELAVQTLDGNQTVRVRCRMPLHEGEQLVVGRSSPHSDVVVEDSHVSKRHFRVYVQSARTMIEDLQSRWGTAVNGRRIHQPVRLRHGDMVRFGKSTARYSCYGERLRQLGQAELRSTWPPVADELGPHESREPAPQRRDVVLAGTADHTPPPAATRDRRVVLNVIALGVVFVVLVMVALVLAETVS